MDSLLDSKKKLFQFVFFGSDKKKWDQRYVSLIKNSKSILETTYYWYINGSAVWSDGDYKKYRIRGPSINDKGTILDNNEDIFTRMHLRKFSEDKKYQEEVNKGIFPKEYEKIDQKNIIFRNFIRNFQIKKGSYEKTLWSVKHILPSDENYFASFIIYNNEIIGYALAEILKEGDTEGDYRAYSTNGYISSVKIREDFQNKHLCTPLVTFLVKELKKEGMEKILIENASLTKNGIPACFCYYKAGINNNYNMYNQTLENEKLAKKNSDVKLNKMTLEFCLTPNIKSRYYYISRNIGKTAKKKIKKVTNSIAFVSRIKKKSKKKH